MKKAIIFGAGNIGRGFIGQLFAESGFETTFIDIDQDLLNLFETEHAYNLETVFNDEKRHSASVRSAAFLRIARKRSPMSLPTQKLAPLPSAPGLYRSSPIIWPAALPGVPALAHRR